MDGSLLYAVQRVEFGIGEHQQERVFLVNTASIAVYLVRDLRLVVERMFWKLFDLGY